MRSAGGNNTCKKLAVTCFNEHLCFVSSAVLADSFVLQNPLARGSLPCAVFLCRPDNNKYSVKPTALRYACINKISTWVKRS